eukprot:GHVL01019934.1.p1 GENE.GHVL01019934.1~~GHVL01019934.1.p1  ORF type:complete len:365 (-),score=93.32 GHVL01019934.1:1963-3057(-)
MKNDDFVGASQFLGTEMVSKDILELEEQQLRSMKPWDQTVRDEQGRRRFHGAFTGGFSAGYYMTVGSKEGWAPSEFKSSRESRVDHSKQRVEDFMDEEDRKLMPNADKKLLTQPEFQQPRQLGGANSNQSTSKHADFEDFGILDLIVTEPRIGEKILRNLGWRPGRHFGSTALHRGVTKPSTALHRDVTKPSPTQNVNQPVKRQIGVTLPMGMIKKEGQSTAESFAEAVMVMDGDGDGGYNGGVSGYKDSIDMQIDEEHIERKENEKDLQMLFTHKSDLRGLGAQTSTLTQKKKDEKIERGLAMLGGNTTNLGSYGIGAYERLNHGRIYMEYLIKKIFIQRSLSRMILIWNLKKIARVQDRYMN